MIDENIKAERRWTMTKAVLAYVGIMGVGMFAMAAFGNLTGVTALTGFAYGVLSFAASVLGVNLISPTGGFKQKG